MWMDTPVILGTTLALFTLLLSRHWRLFTNVIQTFPRDITGIIRYFRSVRIITKVRRLDQSVGDVFDETVAKNRTKICFQTEGGAWTFGDVWDLANQIGNYFQSQGYKKGDSVALFMENRPEFLCVWMGLSKIGVVTYLVNTNLRCHPLKHSFGIAEFKSIIYEEKLAQAIAEVFENELKTGNHVKLISYDSNSNATKTQPNSPLSLLKQESISLRKQLSEFPTTNPIPRNGEKPTVSDVLFCIYTSGTTGLPKAAIVKHSRFIGASIFGHRLSNLRTDDIIYTCLPLYHSVAEFFGAGLAVVFGNTVVLRSKFSAKSFWRDCIDNKITVAQHIGELCRYLLSQPVTPEEKQHQVRVMTGNGLRPEIWKEFVTRFNIPHITETYGSTEGNCHMLNFDNRVGAVGFVPILLYKLYPVGLFKIDEATGELLRDPKSGKAIRCLPNEPGELCGKIIIDDPYREFGGYAKDKQATKKKIVENVFSMGDIAFRTGDYLMMDELGYFYFKDRAGDTFRWKGENVSTAEVESVISNICALKDCVVYGVGIPGTDGKAGMAAIADPSNSLDLDGFAEGIKKALPSYARPLFIRVMKELPKTGTHKLKKMELQNEGFDIKKISEPLFLYSNGKYTLMDEELFQKVITGKIRL